MKRVFYWSMAALLGLMLIGIVIVAYKNNQWTRQFSSVIMVEQPAAPQLLA